jgi:hypothetical protein
MIDFMWKISRFAAFTVLLLSAQSAFAGACVWGECSEMTNEFRDGTLRPKTIALLPARTSMTEDGVFEKNNKVAETAELEDKLGMYLEAQMTERGYEVRRVTFDEIAGDQKLGEFLNAANDRYDEEYTTIVAFKVNDVKNRRYTTEEAGRRLASYLGVDAVAFPRLQILGSSSTSKFLQVVGGSDDKAGGIWMEFALVHARTGDVEAFFGGVSKSSSGSFGGITLKKINKKGDKYMKSIAKTATKEMPKVDEMVKLVTVDEDARELVLHDEVSEEDVLEGLEGLLDEG